MTPVFSDQGTRYELAAAIADLAVLTPLAAVHPGVRAVPLDVPGLGLLPVTGEFAAAVTPAMICTVLPGSVADGTPATGTPAAAVLTGPESGFHRLTPELLALLEAGSMAGRIGYVEADYIGREGRQAAAVWEAGSMVVEPMLLGRNEPYSPGRAPISVALNRLGVAGSGHRDAFVIAGLGRHRRTAEWC